MKILVTGTKGFIGKNLYDQLFLLGHEVLRVEEDFYNYKYWKQALYKMINNCEYIFHVGAISDTSLQDAKRMFFFNYETSKVIIDYANRLGKKVIYSSSAANYGLGDGIPNNIYGWSKKLAEDYGIAAGGQFVALRYFNVYGPGEEHKGKMSSIGYQAFLNKGIKLFPSTNGEIKRDFIYVDDVIEANIDAMDPHIPRGVFDVGTANPVSFEEFVSNMGVKYDHTDPSDIPSWYQYYTKADENKWLPGWSPQCDIVEGCKKYLKYLNH